MAQLKITRSLALIAAVIAISPVSAKGLQCKLPSLKNGVERERLVIRLSGADVTVLETVSESPTRVASTGARAVLFHQYTDPKQQFSSGPIKVEEPHSVILLKSNYKGTEFAADLLVVDWGHGKLKSASSYYDRFSTNWRCTRID